MVALWDECSKSPLVSIKMFLHSPVEFSICFLYVNPYLEYIFESRYQRMRRFEENLKERAHMNRIRQAKTTLGNPGSSKPPSKLNSSKIGAESQLLLQLYDKKNYDAIPAYKLLRTAGLQQYTRGFIQRGYGINLGRLALISSDAKAHLYEQLKILPGHTVKLDKIIDSLAKNSYTIHNSMAEALQTQDERLQEQRKLKILAKKDIDYEKQLERVLNQYTPVTDPKKKTHQSKYSQKKTPSVPQPQSKLIKTKYSTHHPHTINKSFDFKKKTAESTRQTTRKLGPQQQQHYQQNKKQSLARLLKTTGPASMSSKKVMEIDLEMGKVRALNRSFDGALMSSTIANIDIEELVYAFSGYVASQVIAAPEPKVQAQKEETEEGDPDDIDDEVGDILKQSFLHPLYKAQNQAQVEQQLNFQQDACSEGEEQQQDDYRSPHPRQTSFQNQPENDTMMECSFIGGHQSMQFGVSAPLKIFEQPEPTTVDYFKPTIDSVSNFIKNIVLSAKMQRQIPIMAAAYLETFLIKSRLPLTSLNYKRLLVSVLLLASKIWDDESFQTPSFSKTFPQYSTVLLNEMQKQVVKFLEYKLKIDKKEYTKIFFRMRRHTKQHIKSYQNKKLTLKRIRELQKGEKKEYRSHFMVKRNSY